MSPSWESVKLLLMMLGKELLITPLLFTNVFKTLLILKLTELNALLTKPIMNNNSPMNLLDGLRKRLNSMHFSLNLLMSRTLSLKLSTSAHPSVFPMKPWLDSINDQIHDVNP
jgi:hypothetical protein